jgi:hypothetical protein
VTLEDVRQLVPWILHEKLVQNPTSPFFDQKGNDLLRIDKVAWIRGTFDQAMAEYDRLGLDRSDPVATIGEKFDAGLDGLPAAETKRRIAEVERALDERARASKLLAHVHDDILKLKYFHQRYSNYLRWLDWKASRGGQA